MATSEILIDSYSVLAWLVQLFVYWTPDWMISMNEKRSLVYIMCKFNGVVHKSQDNLSNNDLCASITLQLCYYIVYKLWVSTSTMVTVSISGVCWSPCYVLPCLCVLYGLLLWMYSAQTTIYICIYILFNLWSYSTVCLYTCIFFVTQLLTMMCNNNTDCNLCW